tara:strand:+ start:767 stop:2215 length:1449 start_codon:yes stop_codon:yes gene_type:complete
MIIPDLNLVATLPLLFLSAWACVLLIVGLWISKDRTHVSGWLTCLGLIVTIVLVVSAPELSQEAFGGMLAIDGFSNLLHLLFLGSGLLVTLLSLNYLKQHDIERSEFYPLLLFSVVGMMSMAMAKDLIVVFLSLELLSIPLYVLAGLARTRTGSQESALKYFLLGAFASAFQVYGIALVYGATQSTSLASITASIAVHGSTPLLLSGIGLVLVGFCFKVGAVPFHMWTPDVYEGAPSIVTTFMSVGAKAAGFAALIRVFFEGFELVAVEWAPLMAIFAILSTIVGNITAISQKSIKRLLAYSSIAHAGYLFVAIVAGGQGDSSDFAASAVVFYLFAYAFANIGAWTIVIALEKTDDIGTAIGDFAGLARSNPGLGVAMTIFVLSLTGLPPTMGFVAKFYVFRAAVNVGYTWLVIASVATVLISAYYYLRIIVLMWMKDGNEIDSSPVPLNFVVVLAAVTTLLFGVLPGPVMGLLEKSIQGIF